MIIDYYTILDVKRDANLDTIKKAFREKIALHHPENSTAPNARAQFNITIEAFNVLSDAKKRKAYDDMLNNTLNTNLPTVITPEQEDTYEEWQKEAKKKSNTSWETPLTDLLLLDIFFDAGFGFLDVLGDELSDAVGDIFDLF